MVSCESCPVSERNTAWSTTMLPTYTVTSSAVREP